MTYGVIEGERSVCAHCTDCDEFANVRGWTEGKTWEIATAHVRDTGHGVMMHWRQFLSPFDAPPVTTEDGSVIPEWELELLRKDDHEHKE